MNCIDLDADTAMTDRVQGVGACQRKLGKIGRIRHRVKRRSTGKANGI